ncbi:Ig-like domain-containing protein [Streptomyces sp. H10-C2]|uniref:L,D-transpeptidase n=1 Tax=unclassified Streptomyces TaxID=2593676 RepID=UPI0024BA3E55|nr:MULTISPECIES: Ig-like domain-containing protein [unclassified Streptomyces]MDJ0341488.1 Ig-like domain-containing protein [Streptomyces sp. PH10-H1]MDJ0369145.1 Ig-like domain-containing protein [Streptomyces sp. H10-C2]
MRALAVPALLAVALTACGGGGGSAKGGDGKGPAASTAAVPVTVTPANGKTGVDPGSPVKVSLTEGTLAAVTVTAAAKSSDGVEAVEVTGKLDAAKHTWQSDRTMTPGTAYTVKISAADASGAKKDQTSTFTTLAAAKTNGVTITPVGSAVVGVGQPVSIAFDKPVTNRAAVEKQLSVTTTPAVQGSWGWITDPLTGTQRVDWRPATYWTTGTKVTMTAKLSGLDTGSGRYLRRDVNSTFTIGTARVSKVDIGAKKMTVTEDGKTVKTILISAGKSDFPTWNGRMTVISKESTIHMTSTSVGIATNKDAADFYDKDVKMAVHLTTSGTFVHAAPWNDANMGKANTSHGCVGMSDADAKWFFDKAVRGDVVEVTGSTRATVDKGNGYGDWNLTPEAWAKLSALS